MVAAHAPVVAAVAVRHKTVRRSRIEAHGNVLTAASFLYGLCSGELSERELEEVDPEFVMLITARAQKRNA